MWMKFNSLATPQQDSAAGQEEDTVTYRQFALGILGARIYQGNNPAVLIAQPAVLDFDREGAALILDAGVVQPGSVSGCHSFSRTTSLMTACNRCWSGCRHRSVMLSRLKPGFGWACSSIIVRRCLPDPFGPGPGRSSACCQTGPGITDPAPGAMPCCRPVIARVVASSGSCPGADRPATKKPAGSAGSSYR